ncbi:MAG: hypothetical protein JWO87_3217 [Phycisphaerales bacterium]|nr:hypothetical protein [Phycisphaerales bacterium]
MKCRAGRTAIWIFANNAITCLTLFAVSVHAAEAREAGDDVFKTAVAAWHMGDLKDAAGKSDLEIVGAVEVGSKLEGRELKRALDSGNDGLVARIEGGYPTR